ncbi:KamA family radical SAM protein [Brucepastera parasyntrophica]|uniref:KamA family radical SAM protein n=1 Tax=Brucepastera parasyntrophica TaxID=2880008 RepID=UPI00210EA699|nr:KamA family radical SAM protein [Brucepastera parasyntrophica]ULQ60506.1 KamA family radical SAM protein [Brucepastera parasyntrophica]
MTEHDPLSYDWRKTRVDGNNPADLPFLVSPAFKKLIDLAASPADREALRKQVEPSENEHLISPAETADPLGESRYCITPRLVHQYKNRVLLLVTGQCLGYCRYCFRRTYTSRSFGFISNDELEKVCGYLEQHPEVREILVSGGDPLSAPYKQLAGFLEKIREARTDILIRIGTRAPVFAPGLFSRKILSFFRSLRPLWVIPHINHPAELGEEQRKCLAAIRDSGIPMQSQTVLLREINDTPEILSSLFHELVCLGIKPGYLFQCDLAPGTSHFRVPLEQGINIWKELRQQLSGLSLPVFAVDLPDGGGKFPLSVPALSASVLYDKTGGFLSAAGIDGKVYTYKPDSV